MNNQLGINQNNQTKIGKNRKRSKRMEQFEAYMKVLKLWRNRQPSFGGHNDHKQLKMKQGGRGRRSKQRKPLS